MICPHCEGRGFKIGASKLLSRQDGSEVATLYKPGVCKRCDGSGQINYRLTRFGKVLIVALAMLAGAGLHAIFGA